jgi:hypothetical protein
VCAHNEGSTQKGGGFRLRLNVSAIAVLVSGAIVYAGLTVWTWRGDKLEVVSKYVHGRLGVGGESLRR